MRLSQWLSSAGVLLIALALLLACPILADWLIAPRGGPWTEGSFESETHRSATLDRAREVAYRRVKIKSDIARAVIEEQMTLLEAAAHYRDLNRTWDKFQVTTFRGLYAGGSDEERCCREVIAWVRNILVLVPPSQREGIATQLEEQLQAHLRCGSLQLPDVGR
jgi:hypothetical protein